MESYESARRSATTIKAYCASCDPQYAAVFFGLLVTHLAKLMPSRGVCNVKANSSLQAKILRHMGMSAVSDIDSVI